MSDDGFDFGNPPPRREARRFEPPPWERDQFEQHKREQEERERAERERAQAQLEAAAAAAAIAAGGASPTATSEEQAKTASDATESAAPVSRGKEPAGAPAETTQVDEKQLAMMMLELRADEPPTFTRAWMVVLGAGVVLALIGIVIAIWGVSAFARVGAAAGPGGSVLVLFGVAFAGIGGWLVYLGLRRRGVL